MWAPLCFLMSTFVAGVWVVGGPDTCIQLVTVELVRRECKYRGDLEEDQGGGEGLKKIIFSEQIVYYVISFHEKEQAGYNKE